MAERFSGPLTFGTAGLRGPVRAGPNGMNVAVVRAAAAGLVTWLAAHDADGPGRHRLRCSARLPAVRRGDRPGGHRRRARGTAAAGSTADPGARLRGPDMLDAAAGVMVTASHNPPADNGYKVYLGAALGGPVGAGAQIVPPVDAEIEAAIRAVGPLVGGPARPTRHRLWTPSVVESYLDAAAAVVDPGIASADADRRVHPAARGGRAPCWPRCSPGRVPAAGGRGRAGRAGPGLPHRGVPQPGGAGGDGPGDRAGRRRPAPTSPSPTTRTPTGARWRCPSRAAGGCCAATRWACCSPTT